MNTTALDSSITSRFHQNTTIGDILDKLMVESWNWSIDHADYYVECHPAECVYTVVTRNDAIYIVTTLIGLIGGLMTGLKLMVSMSMSLSMKFSGRTNTNTVNDVHDLSQQR